MLLWTSCEKWAGPAKSSSGNPAPRTKAGGHLLQEPCWCPPKPHRVSSSWGLLWPHLSSVPAEWQWPGSGPLSLPSILWVSGRLESLPKGTAAPASALGSLAWFSSSGSILFMVATQIFLNTNQTTEVPCLKSFHERCKLANKTNEQTEQAQEPFLGSC